MQRWLDRVSYCIFLQVETREIVRRDRLKRLGQGVGRIAAGEKAIGQTFLYILLIQQLRRDSGQGAGRMSSELYTKVMNEMVKPPGTFPRRFFETRKLVCRDSLSSRKI